MTVGSRKRGRLAVALGLLGVLVFATLGCGGGGGSSSEDTEDIYVLRFSVPNFSGILLDEALTFVFTEGVDPTSLNHDSIRLRTGPQGGIAPRGVFQTGIFLIDAQGRRVVVDPNQLTSQELANAEQTGSAAAIPEGARYDDPFGDGFNAVEPGLRQVLFNRSINRTVTFVPEVPTKEDFSDTGYRAGSTYTVVLPAFPSLNTVRSYVGDPLVPREGRVFVSTFTTVGFTAPKRFLGGEYIGLSPRGVSSQPPNGSATAKLFYAKRGWSAGTDYEVGERVSNNGLVYRATTNHNSTATSEPGVGGLWVNFWTQAGVAPEDWQQFTSYFVGDEVFLNNRAFTCLQSHFSGPANNPESAPDFWSDLLDADLSNASLRFGAKFVIPDDRAPLGLLNGADTLLGLPAETPTGVDLTIALRFSQPLDPETVSTDNMVLTDDSAGGVQIPVSLFLRQSRVGTVEVLMTPLRQSGLELGKGYLVTVGNLVTDLLGNGLDQNVVTPGVEPFTISFRTAGTLPVTNLVETFATGAGEDTALTTANWNNRLGPAGYVGGLNGSLTASFAPFAGTGELGEFEALAGPATVLDTGNSPGNANVFNYTTFFVETGGIVTGTGDLPLLIRCQQTANIQGSIFLDGGPGGIGQTGDSGNTVLTGGAGGIAGPGGFDGGAGAFNATVENFDGQDGFGPGGGRGGHSGDREPGGVVGGATDEAVQREGGGGGGHATPGFDASLSKKKFSLSPNDGGAGGAAYGPIIPPIVGSVITGFGGSGGGGGGGEDDSDGGGTGAGDGLVGFTDEGGGGGGGGGGALQIVAYGNISLSPGEITANGGQGGNSFNAATSSLGQGAPGGGGSGGSVWLRSFGEITFGANSRIEAIGSRGGAGDGNGNEIQSGGTGADGFIRFEDSKGVPSLPTLADPIDSGTSGTFEPDITLQSVAVSRFYNSNIATPNYGDPEADIFLPGKIDETLVILVQGAREDVTNPGHPVDPDTDLERIFTTDWVPFAEVDRLDNFQFLRFQVVFAVSPLQTFDDPLPRIDEIRIKRSSIPD